ncbi:MAG TPA: hypothetical protein VGR78_02550 [Verrucomicrobiae bacterium]|nr:hypothetical protein [Verrucomicrobiae bacterium]
MAAVSGAHAQELLADGDFEGQDLPWVVSAVPGSNVTLFSQNSPFDYPYPIGSSSLELVDDDSEDEFPSLRQHFSGPAATILLSFDFKAPLSANNSSWSIAWESQDGVPAFFFAVGGQDGSSLELNDQVKIAALAANKWYHLQAYAEVARHLVEGFVVGENGQRADFHGGFSTNTASQLNSVYISDGTPQRNEILLLDNLVSRRFLVDSMIDALGEQVLNWLGSTNVVLQSTPVLTSNTQWSTIPTTDNKFTNTLSGSAQFFRLFHP